MDTCRCLQIGQKISNQVKSDQHSHHSTPNPNPLALQFAGELILTYQYVKEKFTVIMECNVEKMGEIGKAREIEDTCFYIQKRFGLGNVIRWKL